MYSAIPLAQHDCDRCRLAIYKGEIMSNGQCAFRLFLVREEATTRARPDGIGNSQDRSVRLYIPLC